MYFNVENSGCSNKNGKSDENSDRHFKGSLYITVNKKEKKISDGVLNAWRIDDGKNVIYSIFGGADEYENEEQSLILYVVESDETIKILSEYYMIDTVAEKKLSNGLTAILVLMSNGELGASSFVGVDKYYRKTLLNR